ncbi:MAG: alanine dehydrogenase [Flavobacteriales bacterium]
MESLSPFSKKELIPQAERLEVGPSKEKIRIGLPRESHFQEKRIGLTPDAVSVLIANGHEVLVETGAGAGASYSDHQYSEAGAKISHETAAVFSQPVVLKIEPPAEAEIQMLAERSTLISALQINTCAQAYFTALAQKKSTGIAIDFISDETGGLLIVRTISEIVGTTSILIAGELMSNTNGGNGVLLGSAAGIAPAEVVILGAGTVGEFAAKSALGLGASIKVFDHSIANLRKLQNNLNHRTFTSLIDPKRLTKALQRCDVAIGAIRAGGERTPILVGEDTVREMKYGAIIIDVSIDHGGTFETSEVTTHDHPTFVKHDVIHYGVTNIASRVSRTASMAMSNYLSNYIIEMGRNGGLDNLLKCDTGLRKGVYLYKGVMTKREVSQWFHLPFTDIDLLIF